LASLYYHGYIILTRRCLVSRPAWLTVSSLFSMRQLSRLLVFVARSFKLAVIVYQALHGTAPQYLSDWLQYIAYLPTTRQGRLHSSTFLTSARRGVSLLAIALLLLLAHDSGTVYLPTSCLPHHSQHFVRNWKRIYFGHHTETLFCSCVTINQGAIPEFRAWVTL